MGYWSERGYGAATIAAGVPSTITGARAWVPTWAAVIVAAGLPSDLEQQFLRATKGDPEVQHALEGLEGLPFALLRPTVRALAGG